MPYRAPFAEVCPEWADRFFWPKIRRASATECWIWTRTKVSSGYGQIALPGPVHQVARAHRMAWRLTHGPVPDGLSVLHHCDNPPCCTPAHLFLGTHLDNMADMHRKGRASGGRTSRRGEESPAAKVTAAQVSEIRARRARGETGRSVAKAFGLSPAEVSRIKTGKRWAING